MDWLNYHHLYYFWTVVREGSVSRAAEHLRLAQPTVSAQIKLLERALGEPLLERQGRRVVPTEVGLLVQRFADEIFQLGRELQATVKGRPTGRAVRLRVGVANAVPKLMVVQMLRPALDADAAIQVSCHEGQPEQLFAQLAAHALDVVISDGPAASHLHLRVFSHLLGESGTTFFAQPAVARRVRRGFPESLRGVPVLLPTPATALRRSLDQWFDAVQVRPEVGGEFDDSALLKAFGAAGTAVFPAPTAIASEVCQHYGVAVAGTTDDVTSRYFAISVERRVTHPGVVALSKAARAGLSPAAAAPGPGLSARRRPTRRGAHRR
ncbi:MAG: transcriptional activator NhaR [Vicinamibacterales bacterium]